MSVQRRILPKRCLYGITSDGRKVEMTTFDESSLGHDLSYLLLEDLRVLDQKAQAPPELHDRIYDHYSPFFHHGENISFPLTIPRFNDAVARGAEYTSFVIEKV